MNSQKIRQSINAIRSIAKQIPSDIIDSAQVIKDLGEIDNRNKDHHLYLGIVGEFNSGKSTLINALIGKDFFITGAWQGTTTTPTYIRYGDSVNLILEYKDGNKLLYSRHKRRLLQSFLPDEYEKLSFWAKTWICIKDLLYVNTYDELFLKLFDNLTTSDDVAKFVSGIVVEYPSSILENGLVIIDTPGTDSTNPEHKRIAEETIAKKCDMAFVLVPSDRPWSITLASFVERNMQQSLEKCVFFLTKVELLKRAERNRLRDYLSHHIASSLAMNETRLINAPTLLYLEDNNLVEKSGLFDKFSSEEKKELIDPYEKDITTLLEQIYQAKESTIHDKLVILVNKVIEGLSKKISQKSAELQKHLSNLQRLRTKPLQTFMTEFFQTANLKNMFYGINLKLKNKMQSESDSYMRAIFKRIDSITPQNSDDPKDEVQDIMESNFGKGLKAKFRDNCHHEYTLLLEKMQKNYEESFANMQQEFLTTYAIQTPSYDFHLESRAWWSAKYPADFSKENLTRFFRFLKSLSEVKEEMKENVRPYITRLSSNNYEFYSKNITSVNADLEKQMSKIIKDVTKKYNKIILDRIAFEAQQEIHLQEEIRFYQNLLASLEAENQRINN